VSWRLGGEKFFNHAAGAAVVGNKEDEEAYEGKAAPHRVSLRGFIKAEALDPVARGLPEVAACGERAREGWLEADGKSHYEEGREAPLVFGLFWGGRIAFGR
jgi:hypothetical protein